MYLLIECVEREIIVTPCGNNKSAAMKSLCESFIEVNEPYLTKEEIDMLRAGEFPSFEEDQADIWEIGSWSNMNSSRNYDSIIFELDNYDPVFTTEDALEKLKSVAPWKDYGEYEKDPDIREEDKKVIKNLCDMRDLIGQILQKYDEGEGLTLDDQDKISLFKDRLCCK